MVRQQGGRRLHPLGRGRLRLGVHIIVCVYKLWSSDWLPPPLSHSTTHPLWHFASLHAAPTTLPLRPPRHLRQSLYPQLLRSLQQRRQVRLQAQNISVLCYNYSRLPIAHSSMEAGRCRLSQYSNSKHLYSSIGGYI